MLGALVVAASSIQLGNPRAESLAQSGPARAGLGQLTASGIGAGPLSPFDALVRSGDPGPWRAALAGVDGVQSAVAPADWRRDGTGAGRGDPDAGRQLARGPSDARPRARGHRRPAAPTW